MKTLIPFIVLIIGLIWNWRANKRQKIGETKNFRYVIFSWIDSTHDSLEKQYNKLYKLSKAIKLSEDANPERFEYLALSYNKLNTMSLDKYIYMFVINCFDKDRNVERQIANVTKLISSLEYLTQVSSYIKEKYEDYSRSYKNNMDHCNTYFLKLLGLIKEVDSHRDKYNKSEMELHKRIIYVVNNYIAECSKANNHAKGKTLIFKILVSPIEREIPGYSSAYFNEVKDVIMGYNAIKRQWNADQKGFSKIFEDYANSMKKVDENLRTTERYLREGTIVKNIFHI